MFSTSSRAASPRVVITPAAGFTITWDGNNGGFSSPDAGAGPSNNAALASNGTVPFTSSDLGPAINVPFHRAVNLNDGLYGNSHSWISANGVGGASDPDPFAGLSFAASVDISSIAWSRDNGDSTEKADGTPFTDRTVGTYTLQFTSILSPDATTAETGDANTGWAPIGTVQYLAGAEDANFTSYLRHRFDVAQDGNPIAATGLRIKVSDGNLDIDEIEVNPLVDPIPPIGNFIEIIPAAGFEIGWDHNEGLFSTTNSPAPAPVNDASASRGAIAFGSSEVDLGVHFIRNVNDGFYGNSHSWIAKFTDPADLAPFIGINFGKRLLLQSLAWSRDNGDVAGDCCGGTLTDRTLGVYVVQITTVTNPGVATPDACGPTPESGWVTVGTINYKSDNASVFNSPLRHRFDLSQGGGPIAATGIRLLVPNNNIDIDEIEVNGNLAIEQNAIRITNAAGFTIVWDGNDGQFSDPNPGAGPPPNIGLASQGTIPFASSELGPVLNLPYHFITNLNDGLYGNSHSWICANGVGGTSDPLPFAGLSFSSAVTITNLAWGRDNGDATSGDTGCGGTCTDRSLDTYSLQYTTVNAPDATTPETGDPATGWADIGSVSYLNSAAPFFTPYLRHRFEIVSGSTPLSATGIRIKVGSNTDLDEIEVNTSVTAPPALGPVGITPATGYEITWDGNDGQFYDPGVGAAPPLNEALASEGTTPFASSELGPLIDVPFHRAVNLNDGRYGNSFSWISANGIGGNSDGDPFAGLSFAQNILITNVAWSRDNGDNAEFVGIDRAVGIYTLQFTLSLQPDATTSDTGDPMTGWATIGTIEYRRGSPPDFNPYLRHRFDVAASGAPIEATGLRLKVSNGQIDLDEIEVNTPTTPPLPKLRISGTSTNALITWSGGGGLESSTSVTGPWTCVSDALPTGYTVSLTPAAMRFYRVRH